MRRLLKECQRKKPSPATHDAEDLSVLAKLSAEEEGSVVWAFASGAAIEIAFVGSAVANPLLETSLQNLTSVSLTP